MGGGNSCVTPRLVHLVVLKGVDWCPAKIDGMKMYTHMYRAERYITTLFYKGRRKSTRTASLVNYIHGTSCKTPWQSWINNQQRATNAALLHYSRCCTYNIVSDTILVCTQKMPPLQLSWAGISGSHTAGISYVLLTITAAPVAHSCWRLLEVLCCSVCFGLWSQLIGTLDSIWPLFAATQNSRRRANTGKESTAACIYY